MSQNYITTNWEDNKTVGTASVMNNMEKGIENAHNRIDGVDSQIKDIAIPLEKKLATEDDDTQRLQRTIDNAIEGQTILLKPCETLTISSTINCKPGVKINGNNATINYIGDDVLFNCDFSSYSGCKFENLKIVMTKNSTTQIGFKLRRFNNVGGFKNVTIVNGAYGINSVDSYMWTIDNVYIQNPKIAGIYHQGDNGCEFNWSDLTVEIGKDFEGKYGVEIERTTPDDTGGYYLNNCLVLVHKKLGGKLQQGWYVHSSSDSVATVVFNMVLGGADGFNEIDAENGNFAIKLENVSAVRLTNTWMMSVGFCGTDQVMISDSNVAYGMYFKGGKNNNAVLLSNISCGEYIALNFDDDATASNLQYNNVRTHPGQPLSNKNNKITNSIDKEFNKIYIDQSRREGALCLENSNDSLQKIYIRLDAYGSFLLLNKDFSSSIFELRQDGHFNLPISSSQIMIGGQNVVKERQTGWGENPTGIANRNGFETSTVTVEELAQRVSALIIDLKNHGLIGS